VYQSHHLQTGPSADIPEVSDSSLPSPAPEEAAEQIARLQRRLQRERSARQEAERLLETKSLELFTTNRALQELATSLEQRVEQRAAELRAIEAQLQQSQRLEAVGLLAGGIAHDFNNLLMVIGSGAELLREIPPDECGDVLDEVQCAVARGRDLTARLLTFSRKQPVEAEDIDTATAISALAHLLRRLVTERVALSLDLAPGLGVRMSRGSLEQIMMNLAANARDAMPRGGHLRVRSSPRWLWAAEAVLLGLNEGMHVLLEVSDTGSGMSPETVERAFDPFFSTKPVGSGTGLGLSNVYSIVRQSSGHISVETAEGDGSTFRILLPCHGSQAHTITLTTAPLNDLPLATGDVLLVDDDDSVRHMTALLLRRQGFPVREAASGEQALGILANPSIPLAILISDVRMPGMNGFELALIARGRRPGMPALLMSGYVDDLSLQGSIEEAGFTLLEKPVSAEALLQHVRKVLRRSSNSPILAAE
jgi:two-component system, cell cycle sensor histidine kinase and response regulator CckA